MKVVCATCQADLGEKYPFDNPSTSHGMCITCSARTWKDGLQATRRRAREAILDARLQEVLADQKRIAEQEMQRAREAVEDALDAVYGPEGVETAS